jgi:3-phosphoshikimate 1-carboxyvinyltransferase
MLLKKSKLIPNQTVQICGSKSISNRLLILNAFFNNIKIENISDSQDTKLLQNALQSQEEIIDIHHAGTAMRFLTSYFAVQEGKTKILTGSERMKKRPIKDLVNALRDLGAEIEYMEREGFPPLRITGKKLTKNFVKISAEISSQFITSLMLIGATIENGLTIELEGKITSRPYINLTAKTLRNVGIDAKFNDNLIEIKPYKNPESFSNIIFFETESDWSSASYYYSLAALGKEIINLKSFKTHSYQGDSRIKEIFWDYFGINTISYTQEFMITLSPESFAYPEKIELDMNDCPDLAQTVCVTAAALNIAFEITGLETLKIKETDRIEALQNELFKIGCITETTESSIKSEKFFEPNDHISIQTYNDHRMAMSFAPYCMLQEITINNPEVVGKSYPRFWDDLKTIIQ